MFRNVIKGDFVKKYPKGTAVKLLVQPEDLRARRQK